MTFDAPDPAEHYFARFPALCEGPRVKDEPPHGPATHVHEPVLFEKINGKMEPYRKAKKYCERCCPVCAGKTKADSCHDPVVD